MRGDGALTAADTLAARWDEGVYIPTAHARADLLGLVISDAGRAVYIQTISPFLVGVLVVTWPTRQVGSQLPTQVLPDPIPRGALPRRNQDSIRGGL